MWSIGVDAHERTCTLVAKDVALIAKSKRKTDRRDAEIRCDPLRTGYLPVAYAPRRRPGNCVN